jgi:polysaccharide biosynthesis/export protein
MPVLAQRAPRYVYVLGEVRLPGRYTLEAPTTVMQAISMAGSWTVGAHITHVVVFRRVDDWRLVATMLDLRAAMLGRRPCPASEIWVGDADLIIVPKSKLLRADNFIELVFTRGLYGVVPIQGGISYTVFRGLTPLP